MYDLQVFFLFHGFSLYFLDCVVCNTNILHFDVTILSYSFLFCWMYSVISQKPLQNPMSRFTPVFFWQCFFKNYYFLNPQPRISFLLIFREKGREDRERQTDRHRQTDRGVNVRNINQLSPIHALTSDWTCYLGMCPDWDLNMQPFGVWDDAPTSWTTWPGLF